MLKLNSKHFLTGEELSVEEMHSLLQLASELKEQRNRDQASTLLKDKHLALLFEKPSLRTRFSFAIAMHELGGNVIESVGDTRKKEEPEDVIHVLEGYCHAVMIRTHGDVILDRMSQTSMIPIINGLSDLHHPCQILADLLTLKEVFGTLEGLKVVYVGDGNNILHSLLLLAPQMGIDLHYCCPQACQPNEEILKRALSRVKATAGSITAYFSPMSAVQDAHAVYTDVWASMGFENKTDETLFCDFQINEKLMEKALPEAIFMHCMPMNRGKEVSETLPDTSASVIFQQSENRLHVQKALLASLMAEQEGSV